MGNHWPGPPMGPVTTTQVSVPDDCVGRLIGRGGETINRIRQQSGCRIDIAQNDGANTTGLRVVTLSGDQSAIMRAQDMLRQKLAEAQQQKAGAGGYGGNGGGGPPPAPAGGAPQAQGWDNHYGGYGAQQGGYGVAQGGYGVAQGGYGVAQGGYAVPQGGYGSYGPAHVGANPGMGGRPY